MFINQIYNTCPISICNLINGAVYFSAAKQLINRVDSMKTALLDGAKELYTSVDIDSIGAITFTANTLFYLAVGRANRMHATIVKIINYIAASAFVIGIFERLYKLKQACIAKVAQYNAQITELTNNNTTFSQNIQAMEDSHTATSLQFQREREAFSQNNTVFAALIEKANSTNNIETWRSITESFLKGFKEIEDSGTSTLVTTISKLSTLELELIAELQSTRRETSKLREELAKITGLFNLNRPQISDSSILEIENGFV